MQVKEQVKVCKKHGKVPFTEMELETEDNLKTEKIWVCQRCLYEMEAIG